MSRRGELNLGQLVRRAHPDESLLVGFTTDHGTVTAASEWGGPAERKRVRPALAASHEHLFHRAQLEQFLLLLDEPALAARREPLLERAIGVIYRPETERASHWFHADLARQFDAVIHLDRTTAVEPLERTSLWDAGEPPETYPTGL
jgi:erythromycin esterase-like protein